MREEETLREEEALRGGLNVDSAEEGIGHIDGGGWGLSSEFAVLMEEGEGRIWSGVRMDEEGREGCLFGAPRGVGGSRVE